MPLTNTNTVKPDILNLLNYLSRHYKQEEETENGEIKGLDMNFLTESYNKVNGTNKKHINLKNEHSCLYSERTANITRWTFKRKDFIMFSTKQEKLEDKETHYMTTINKLELEINNLKEKLEEKERLIDNYYIKTIYSQQETISSLRFELRLEQLNQTKKLNFVEQSTIVEKPKEEIKEEEEISISVEPINEIADFVEQSNIVEEIKEEEKEEEKPIVKQSNKKIKVSIKTKTQNFVEQPTIVEEPKEEIKNVKNDVEKRPRTIVCNTISKQSTQMVIDEENDGVYMFNENEESIYVGEYFSDKHYIRLDEHPDFPEGIIFAQWFKDNFCPHNYFTVVEWADE